MKICYKCGAQIPDDAVFCPVCGTSQTSGQTNGQYNTFTVDPHDHTAEFEATDVSDHKVYAMLCYLFGILGVIIALLAGQNSPYLKFHVRQAIKLEVTGVLLGIIAVIAIPLYLIPFFNILVILAVLVFSVMLLVIKIISFFRICAGKSIEPPIVKNFGFLK